MILYTLYDVISHDVIWYSLYYCFICVCFPNVFLRACLSRRGAAHFTQVTELGAGRKKEIAQPRDNDLPNGACLTEHTHHLHLSGS